MVGLKPPTIYPLAKIVGSNFSLGEGSQIDDFTFINTGKGMLVLASEFKQEIGIV